MEQAVKEYLRREQEANETPAGADVMKIGRAVAEEHSVAPADLMKAVFDYTVQGAC